LEVEVVQAEMAPAEPVHRAGWALEDEEAGYTSLI
jgi:hypothetical protein